MPSSVSIKVWGDLACFTRPELKVERMSYPLMTPSAARGILDGIMWKPQMSWHVRRISILKPPQFVSIRRNEIQGKIAPRTVSGWMSSPETFAPYLVDSAGRESAGGQNRTQRNTLALRDVAYVIEATPRLTDKANRPRSAPPDADEEPGPDTIAKYVAMFQRRVQKGQCFHRPYLGCREFTCHFSPCDGDEQPIDWTENLGFLLYDIQFQPQGDNVPGFFNAKVHHGVLHCDTLEPAPTGEPPIQVHGWQPSTAEVQA